MDWATQTSHWKTPLSLLQPFSEALSVGHRSLMVDWGESRVILSLKGGWSGTSCVQQRNEFLWRRAGCQLRSQIPCTVPQTRRTKGSNALNRLFFLFVPRSVAVAWFPRPKLKYWDFSTTDMSLFLFGNGTHHSRDTSNTRESPRSLERSFSFSYILGCISSSLLKTGQGRSFWCCICALGENEKRSDTVCLPHTTIIPCNMFANLLLFVRDTVSTDGFLVFRWIYCILTHHSEWPVKSVGLREHLLRESRCVNKNYRKRKGEQLGQPAWADVWWTSFGRARALFLFPVIN